MTIGNYMRTCTKQARELLINAGPTAKNAGKKISALFVVGNESADMDSCISSILSAYFCKQAIDNKILYQDLKIDIVAPLMNMNRGDLRIRRDIDQLLGNEQLSESLLYLDDIEQLSSDSNNYVFIVDCNKLTDFLTPIFPSDRVVGVIDHHADEGLYKTSIENAGGPRVIRKSGSCSSIVINYWSDLLRNKLESNIFSEPQVARIACAPLLIDTSGMKKKVEADDREAFQRLQVVPEASDPKVSKKFLKELESLKKDISTLSVRDIIRKDYKRWNTLGISSTVKPLTWMYQNHLDFNQCIVDFAEETGLSAYAILCAAVVDEKFQREIGIWVKDNETKAKIGEFASSIGESLQLEHLTIPESATVPPKAGEMIFFKQNNVLATRKQVAPLMRQAMFGHEFAIL